MKEELNKYMENIRKKNETKILEIKHPSSEIKKYRGRTLK
jgi:hypothetical protein